MVGARVNRLELRRANLRFPFPDLFSDRLLGRTICQLRRRAKYLLIDLDKDETMIAHLGMSGSFRIDYITGSEAPGVTVQSSKNTIMRSFILMAALMVGSPLPTMIRAASDSCFSIIQVICRTIP